jgi:hypothetical protein
MSYNYHMEIDARNNSSPHRCLYCGARLKDKQTKCNNCGGPI